MIYKSKEIRL